MKVIIANPGGGKTKALLALSAEKNIPVLVESNARAQRLIIKADGYGYSIPAPVTLNELEGVKAVLIDDIESFFTNVFNVKVEAITLNNDSNMEIEELK